MARPLALCAAIAALLLAVAGAGGAATQQTPKRGGTLVIATRTESEPACLNPLNTSCGSPFELRAVLAGAFEEQPDGTLRPNVASAELVAREPFTLVYHIRPEVSWSDGAPIGARDFAFTYRALRRYQQDSYESQHVRSVRVLDRKTVEVVLRAPAIDWRLLFSVVLPSHALAGADLERAWRDGIDNPKTGAPIASGPFLVGPWKRGRALALVRNPRYWGPHVAYLRGVTYRFMPADDTAESVLRGEADMVDPFSARLQSEHLELVGKPGIRVLTVPSSSWEQLAIRVLGTGHPALEQRLVRQALAYGIDRVAIARALSKEFGVGLEPLDSVVFLRNSPYYVPIWKRYRYRPDKARSLLEQAGCRLGQDAVYACRDRRLSLRLSAVGGVDRRARTLQLVQVQLRRVGIEAQLEFYPVGVWVNQVIPSGNFDLALFSWIVTPDAPPVDIYGCQGSSNFTGYCDRLLTRDLLQAAHTFDERRRVALLHRLDARLATAVPGLPLFQNRALFAFRASVRGVARDGARRPEDWWLDR